MIAFLLIAFAVLLIIGSPIAAAAVNAMMYLIDNDRD